MNMVRKCETEFYCEDCGKRIHLAIDSQGMGFWWTDDERKGDSFNNTGGHQHYPRKVEPSTPQQGSVR